MSRAVLIALIGAGGAVAGALAGGVGFITADRSDRSAELLNARSMDAEQCASAEARLWKKRSAIYQALAVWLGERGPTRQECLQRLGGLSCVRTTA